MALDKELALAIDFKSAPKELQEGAKKHYDNQKAVSKLKNQLAKVAGELDAAEKAAAESAEYLRGAMRAWDPEAVK